MKIARLFLLVMLVATVSAMATQPGGRIIGPPSQGHGGTNSKAACTTYYIDCDWDGNLEDSCCANLDSCLSYCGDVCGGPCVTGGAS
jgi:hypothetical protein